MLGGPLPAVVVTGPLPVVADDESGHESGVACIDSTW